MHGEHTGKNACRFATRGLLTALACSSLLFAAACAGDSYSLGETGPGGGIIFYAADEPFPCGPDLAGNCRFLEAAPADSEALRVWAEPAHVDSDAPGARGSAIGTGWANTLAIIEQGNTDPDVSAAAYADAYEHNGHSDWYLPSKDEIFELYEQREAADASERNNYWTSSGYDFNTVWNQSFVEGPQHRRLKFDQITVRPVRAF